MSHVADHPLVVDPCLVADVAVVEQTLPPLFLFLFFSPPLGFSFLSRVFRDVDSDTAFLV
jgi:hypothetical protein